MKRIKELLIIIMSFMLIIGGIVTTSLAAEANLTVSISNKNVKKGETFTVKLSIASADGINGITGDYSFDENALELVSANVVDSSKFSNLGAQGNKEIALIATTTGLTSEDVLILTFKVKDSATENQTVNISFNNMEVDTNAQTSSTVTLGDKSISATIVSSTNVPGDDNTTGNTDTPDNNTNTSGNTDAPDNSTNTSGNTDTPDNSTNTSEDNTTPDNNTNTSGNTNTSNGNTNNAGNNSIVNNNTNTSTNKTQNTTTNSTTANKMLPYTGAARKVIVVCIIIGIIGAVYTLKKYNSYKDI